MTKIIGYSSKPGVKPLIFILPEETITFNLDDKGEWYGMVDTLTKSINNLSPDQIVEAEKMIAKDSYTAYDYSTRILNGPFPLGEAAIARDPFYAFQYAKDILKGPFPLGEAEIGAERTTAWEYVRDVLQGPFPLGEAVIGTDADYAFIYATKILKGPFPAGETAIRHENSRWHEYRAMKKAGFPQ